MLSNERSTQRSGAAKTGRKVSPGAVRDQNTRNTQYDEELDWLAEDDPYASNPPKAHSTTIRRSPPITTQRQPAGRADVNTDTQSPRRNPPNQIPQRSTQKQSPGQQNPMVAPRPRPAVTTAYDAPKPARRSRGLHWLIYVGLGMFIALGLWVLFTNIVTWGTNEYNNLVYGNPRTFQMDAVVGHSDSQSSPSHFIALNLKGQIIVVEFPGGNPAKAIDYAGPDLISQGEELLPVTLKFVDENHDQKLDMVVSVGDKQFIFYNNGKSFAASTNSGTTPTASATP